MKIAFVDMTFHIQNTKSSQFFIDILSPLGEVHHISNIDAWRIVPKLKPDVLILWQYIITPDEIDSWGVRNVVLIPMYDACPHTMDFWNQYKKYKVFCFSKTLFDILFNNGFDCLHSQYYMKPSNAAAAKSQANIQNAFFWERYGKLSWNTVKNVIEKLPVTHLHYHTGLTKSNSARPSQEEIEKYRITFSTWFENKSDMDAILDSTGIYISPRIEEGIGLSFIEAIAKGNLICAFDAPTMNEYITDGRDGILFTYENFPQKKFSKAKIALMQNEALARAKKGYKAWQNSLDIIRDFIKKPLPDYNPKMTFKGFRIRLVHQVKYAVKKIIGRA